jgi:exosortase N
MGTDNNRKYFIAFSFLKTTKFDLASMFNIKKYASFKKYIPVFLLLAIAFPQLYFYETLESFFLFSMAIFIFSISKLSEPIEKPCLLYCGLLFYLAYYFLQIQSLFLFGFSFLLLYIINFKIGRVNNLPLFVALVALPVSGTVLNLISFDLRLFTTKIVATILSTCLTNASYEGNIIHYGNFEYGVDDVCSGIAMLHIGFLIALMLLAFIEKKKRKTVRNWQIVCLLSIAFLFILIANIFRIVILVVFKLAETSALHEVIGLVSLLIYFALPFYFICNRFARHFFVIEHKPILHIKYINAKITLVVITCLATMLFSIFVLKNRTTVRTYAKNIEGYELKNLKFGVSQYSNANVLIYVKPEVPFYAADHHPKLCWKGSGYKFTNEKMREINGHTIVLAQLVNARNEKMYSAYWFQHNNFISSDELTWRWDAMIHRHKYQMINVTCTKEIELENEIRKFIGRKG